MSKELISLSPEALLRERYEKLSEKVEFIVVANRHLNPQDADKSTALIEPDSIVLIEGYSETEETPWYNSLGIMRSMGVEDPVYMQMARETLLEKLTSEPRGPLDFSQNKAKEILNLLDKRCAIFGGDFYDSTESALGKEVKDIMFSWLRYRKGLEQTFGDPNYAKQYRLLNKTDYASYALHMVRETSTVASTLAWVEQSLKNEKDSGEVQFSLSPEGKVRTYIIFGAAHAKSLEATFKDFGINPIIKNLVDLREHQFLDHHADQENKNRRLAFLAINLMGLAGEDHDNDEETYTKLEKYNYLEDEESKKLILAAMRLAGLWKRSDVEDSDLQREINVFYDTFLS